jgi:iron(III) transport system permease protein
VTAGLAVAIGFLIAYPIAQTIVRLFWSNGRFDPSPIIETATLPGLGKMLLDTAIVVSVSGLLAVLVGSGFAWLNERTDARLGVVTDVLPIVNFLIPSIATAVGWMLLLSPGAGYLNAIIRAALDVVGVHLTTGPFSIYTWYGLIFVYTLHVIPIVFLLVSAGLRSLDPSLEEQSRMSGAGLLRTVMRVTLPSIRPSILAAVFLTTWFGIAVFTIPLVIGDQAGVKILSVRIVELLVFSYPPHTGAVVGLGFIVTAVLGVLWAVQLRILRGQRFAVVTGKNRKPTRIRLSGWGRLARTLMLLYLLLAVVLPVGALALVTLTGFWTTTIDWSTLGFKALINILSRPVTLQSLQNSLTLAAASATVAMTVAGLIAWSTLRAGGRFARLAQAVTKLPAAVSSIVLAVGFVLAFAGEPLFLGGTLAILFLAYLAIAMPEASVTAEAAVGQVGRELGEASYLSGAGDGRTLSKVYLPLMLPGLAAGWALVFVRLVGDVQASSILAGTGNSVVGFQVLGIFENGLYSQLAALALVMTVVSTAVLSLVLVLSARWSARWGQGS